ncbi:hypothetical protein J4462_02390 [Candidatus Pacearchaeota archaeon]|nr:hypothetical protein [Candidatus Pacearchaeota archaeon]
MKSRPIQPYHYIIISLILWIAVEYISVWHSRFQEWMSYMPWALFQYLFIILVFSFFFYKRIWSAKKMFFLMLFMMYLFEFLWQNFLLLNPISFVPISVLLIQLWGFLTFVPFWFVNKQLKQNSKATIFYCLWPVVGFLMALVLG